MSGLYDIDGVDGPWEKAMSKLPKNTKRPPYKDHALKDVPLVTLPKGFLKAVEVHGTVNAQTGRIYLYDEKAEAEYFKKTPDEERAAPAYSPERKGPPAPGKEKGRHAR